MGHDDDPGLLQGGDSPCGWCGLKPGELVLWPGRENYTEPLTIHGGVFMSHGAK